jgi:hypothetical protein
MLDKSYNLMSYLSLFIYCTQIVDMDDINTIKNTKLDFNTKTLLKESPGVFVFVNTDNESLNKHHMSMMMYLKRQFPNKPLGEIRLLTYISWIIVDKLGWVNMPNDIVWEIHNMLKPTWCEIIDIDKEWIEWPRFRHCRKPITNNSMYDCDDYDNYDYGENDRVNNDSYDIHEFESEPESCDDGLDEEYESIPCDELTVITDLAEVSKTFDEYPVLGKTFDEYPVLGKTFDEYPVLGKTFDEYPVLGKTFDEPIPSWPKTNIVKSQQQQQRSMIILRSKK